MKRTLSVLLVLALLVSMLAATGEKEEISEGPSGNLVIYSPMTDSDLEALIACFGEVYPGIHIEVVAGSTGSLISRIRAEMSNPVADMTWGAMMNTDGRMYEDICEEWVSPNDAENPEQFRSTNGLYSMDDVSSVVFCVNTELEAELGLSITGYKDLIDPRLKGKIIFSDPNSSAAAWNNFCNLMSVFGPDSDEAWDYIEKLMPNLVITNSSSNCFKSVQQGEYVVGLSYEDGVVLLLRDGADNIRMQYPEEGTSANLYGCALLKGAPNRDNAILMINFITSAEGQTALAAYQHGTVRYTNSNYVVPEDAWLPPTSELKWVDRDVEFLTENRAQMLDHWNELWATINK